MNTATQDRADELFWDAATALGDDGYPASVTFVPADQDWADEAVWRVLTLDVEPVILVSDLVEFLLMPKRPSLLDRLRGRVRVTVAYRVHGRPVPYATASRLGRHPVQQMRAAADAVLAGR